MAWGDTYYFRSSDITFDGTGESFRKLISLTDEGSKTEVGPWSIPGKASNPDISYAFTTSGDPGSDDWPIGDWTIIVDVSTSLGAGSDIDVAIGRFNSGGTLQGSWQTSNEGVTDASAGGDKTFTFTGLNFGSAATSDRIGIQFTVNNNAHGSANFGIYSGYQSTPDDGTLIITPSADAGTGWFPSPGVIVYPDPAGVGF